jgi:hypothetical protein
MFRDVASPPSGVAGKKLWRYPVKPLHVVEVVEALVASRVRKNALAEGGKAGATPKCGSSS